MAANGHPCFIGYIVFICVGYSHTVFTFNIAHFGLFHWNNFLSICVCEVAPVSLPFQLNSKTYLIVEGKHRRAQRILKNLIWNFNLQSCIHSSTGAYSPGRTFGLPFPGFLITHIQTHGRTPLDEWSARRRDLYLHRTTQHINTRDKHPCPQRDSNPRPQQTSGRRTTP
jgi:hypothetical protein